MEYTVISNKKVCGKVKDEKLTKDDILSAGSNVEFLLAAGHIKAANAAKVTPAVKEVPAVQQEEEVPVFNLDNEQGEKQPWQE
jgi:hypothetical protein